MTGVKLAKQTLELLNALFFNNACVLVALKSVSIKIALAGAVLNPEMENHWLNLGHRMLSHD